jgi:beta-glucosidase
VSEPALRFPEGFLWGAATSSHQVEGDNRLNDWWRFEQVAGKIAHGDVSGEACRHYERFDEDFALAAADGHNAHRFSIEWSRIEPEPGRIDGREVVHYHEVLASLARRGLTPLVTLHHFTNPLWIADHGGWESRTTIDRFAEFVRFCAREFGGEVDWWCTINEPDVYAFRSYSEGLWPPGRRDDGAALAVIANMLEAHGRAYRILHEEDRLDADGDGRAALVGYTKNYPILEPARPWFPLDVLRARLEHRVFNTKMLRATQTGDIDLSIPGVKPARRRVSELARSLDYIGVNYYTRWMVKMFAPDPHVTKPGAVVNDLGWEHHPEGMGRALRDLATLGVPILITENGVADAQDRLRPRALVETLVEVHQAIAAGAPVRGYFHWSLLDNFEWAEGFQARFGLYHVDFGDPERPRTPRRSAALYARIARANAIEPGVREEALRPPD